MSLASSRRADIDETVIQEWKAHLPAQHSTEYSNRTDKSESSWEPQEACHVTTAYYHQWIDRDRGAINGIDCTVRKRRSMWGRKGKAPRSEWKWVKPIGHRVDTITLPLLSVIKCQVEQWGMSRPVFTDTEMCLLVYVSAKKSKQTWAAKHTWTMLLLHLCPNMIIIISISLAITTP